MIHMTACIVTGSRPLNSAAKKRGGNPGALLDLVGLSALMELSRGSPDIGIGLIDGPVAGDHVDLAESPIHEIPTGKVASCRTCASSACSHGTFIAGMLSARRGSDAPAICPACSLLVRPVFREGAFEGTYQPSAHPGELAAAVFDCVDAGARVINLSLSLTRHSIGAERTLTSALNHAMLRGVIVVAAAGNQNLIAGSAITGHPGVIPITACDSDGFPSAYSNAGLSIGGRGLRAPGDGVISSGPGGNSISSSGTSVAAAFVTGAIALLWSIFPAATAQEVKLALTPAQARRTTIIPPLLNALAAYKSLAMRYRGHSSL
jgi:subtilisin family serine protease